MQQAYEDWAQPDDSNPDGYQKCDWMWHILCAQNWYEFLYACSGQCTGWSIGSFKESWLELTRRALPFWMRDLPQGQPHSNADPPGKIAFFRALLAYMGVEDVRTEIDIDYLKHELVGGNDMGGIDGRKRDPAIEKGLFRKIAGDLVEIHMYRRCLQDLEVMGVAHSACQFLVARSK